MPTGRNNLRLEACDSTSCIPPSAGSRCPRTPSQMATECYCFVQLTRSIKHNTMHLPSTLLTNYTSHSRKKMNINKKKKQSAGWTMRSESLAFHMFWYHSHPPPPPDALPSHALPPPARRPVPRFVLFSRNRPVTDVVFKNHPPQICQDCSHGSLSVPDPTRGHRATCCH